MTKRSNVGVYRSALQRLGIFRTVGIACVGLVGAASALALAISGVTRSANPELALRFLPNESSALASRAEQLFAAEPLSPPAAVRTLALASLKQQALNPKALRILGSLAAIEGNEKRANRLIHLSEGQSRRDSGTQLWLIETAVQHGDIKQALAHYNVVLGTHPSTYVTLFPILVRAISSPDIRSAMAPYIKNDQNWAVQFLTHAIASSSDLPALVDLMLRSGGPRNFQAAKIQEQSLMQRLIAQKMFLEARRLYLGSGGTRAARLTATTFHIPDTQDQADSMEWQLHSDADAGGGFIVGKSGHSALSIFANPGALGTVASKLLYLRPRTYAFAATLSQFEADDGGQLRWQLRCPTLSNDKAIWSASSDRRSVNATLSIPGDCPVQYLDVVASGGLGAGGLSATVENVSLRPAR